MDFLRFSRSEASRKYLDRKRRAKGTEWTVNRIDAVKHTVQADDSGEAHIVHLVADEGEFEGHCSCPDFEYRRSVCKHMWAVFEEPSLAVLDVDAALNRSPSLPDETPSIGPKVVTDGGTVAISSPGGSPPSNGAAPDWGDQVEIAVAHRFDLQLVDSVNFDAVATENTPRLEAGTKIQIKGAQEKIRNGYKNGVQQYTAGRLTFWREELLHLIHDDGRYLVVVYDDDKQPSDPGFTDRVRVLTPQEVGEATDGSWYECHRESKGNRAKVSWKRILGSDPDV